tara:strand:+ start:1044 stop:1340 length:297 start_codon:yes stop_codon:yes gene_type:complete
MSEEQNIDTQEFVDNPDQVVDQAESISLQELQVLAQVVDLASQRGAFRGNELSQVGAVYDRLSSFLSAVAAQQEEAAEAQEGEAPAEVPAEEPAPEGE